MHTTTNRALHISIGLLAVLWLIYLERAPVDQHRSGTLTPIPSASAVDGDSSAEADHHAKPRMTAKDATLRVATYNIHRTIGADGIRSADRIGELIKSYDVVALQEVQHALSGDPAWQTPYLGDIVGGASGFAPTKRRWFFILTGNAVVSRYAGSWQSSPILPSTERDRGKVTIRTDIDGLSMTIINVHLSPSALDGDRQLARILEIFKTKHHAILLGDFNVRLGNPIMQQFLESGFAVDALAGRSLNPSRPSWLVDWILVRGLEVGDAGIVHSPASDHPLVWADIRLPRSTVN